MRTSADIRAEARTALRAKGWGASVSAWALWILVGTCANQLIALLARPLAGFQAGSPESASSAVLSLLCMVGAVYYFTFAKVYGVTALAVSVVRGGPRVGYAFSGFACAWRAVGVHLWIGWRILLPALFVLPAIPAWYRYRLAYNVLVDHPDWTGRQVVDRARELAEGRRGALFGVDCWFLLVTLAVYVPGLLLVFRGLQALDFDQVKTLVEVFQGGVGEAELMQRLQSMAPAFGPISLGVLLASAAGLFFTLWVQPYWTTALAAAYEGALDEAEAGLPEDGSVVPAETETT